MHLYHAFILSDVLIYGFKEGKEGNTGSLLSGGVQSLL